MNLIRDAYLQHLQQRSPQAQWELTPLPDGWMAESTKPGFTGRCFCFVDWKKGHPILKVHGNHRVPHGFSGYSGYFAPHLYGKNPNRD